MSIPPERLSDPTPRTTEILQREIASLKELFFARIVALETAVQTSHDDLVRVPTDVQEAVGKLKELLETKVEGNRRECANQFKASDQNAVQTRAILETRFDGNDKAIKLLQDTADKFPARIDEKISSLQQVHEEKFQSIQTQFEERDTRTEGTAKDSKVAVDAALQAAKELVAQQNTSNSLAMSKNETTTTKQIDLLGVQIQTTAKASDEKIDDLKERITRIEGMGVGAITAQNSHAVVKTAEQASSSYMIAIVGAVIAAIGLAAGIIVAVMRG